LKGGWECGVGPLGKSLGSRRIITAGPEEAKRRGRSSEESTGHALRKNVSCNMNDSEAGGRPSLRKKKNTEREGPKDLAKGKERSKKRLEETVSRQV